MLLSEAKQILRKNGYLFEKIEIDSDFEGPRHSQQIIINGKKFTKKEWLEKTNFKARIWNELSLAVNSFKRNYEKFNKLNQMSLEDLAKGDNWSEYLVFGEKCGELQRHIDYYAKGMDVDMGDDIDDIVEEKKAKMLKYTKKDIEDNTDLVGVQHGHFAWPGFEDALEIYIDWGDRTFHKISGYCMWTELSDIPGLDRADDYSDRYNLTSTNINKIGKWLKDNKDKVEVEVRRGKGESDEIAADMKRYYAKHPNGNWSGD